MEESVSVASPLIVLIEISPRRPDGAEPHIAHDNIGAAPPSDAHLAQFRMRLTMSSVRLL
jgi:hypothetical protein